MVASEMTSWAIDLGNTHTRVARWDETADRPKLLELPAICRRPGGEEPLEAPRLVPSATFIPDRIDWSTRFGRWPFVAKRWFYGCEAVIGRPAVEANSVIVNPGFVPNFKLFLDREATRVLARAGRRSLAARDVARCFVRELLAEIKRTTGERIRDVVLTTPVEAFETYRAELLRITAALGIRTVRWVDEPVAAALGYGLSLTQERLILVHDFGGGTLHLALVAMSGKGARRGESSVVAKEGRAIGGKLVDAWLLDEACRRAGFSPPRADDQDDEVEFWRRLMLVEACRVKETVFFGRPATFLLAPPPYARGPAAPGGEKLAKIELSRDDLVALLRAKGLFHTLEECIDGVLTQAARLGISERNIEDVLMVGGSTLLPEVYPTFERRFGREHVRAWQPFEAVAFGACAFAAGRAGVRAGRHPLSDSAGPLEATARAHLLVGRARDLLQAGDLRGRPRSGGRPQVRLGPGRDPAPDERRSATRQRKGCSPPQRGEPDVGLSRSAALTARQASPPRDCLWREHRPLAVRLGVRSAPAALSHEGRVGRAVGVAGRGDGFWVI